MHRTVVFTAIFIGCLIVIWVGTVAAAHIPPQELLAPTLTPIAENRPQNPAANPEGNQVSPEPQSEPNEENCTLPPSYPEQVRQWCQMIESTSIETGIPSSLIAAVILQESGGDHLSYSSSGAVGLMQIMPRDGLAESFMCVNGPCFSSRPTIKELQEPEFNVYYGAQMLAGLYAKHGSYREALFRYGPMDVGYHYADLVLKIWENYQNLR